MYKIQIRRKGAYHDDSGENGKHKQCPFIAYSFHEDLFNGGAVQLEPHTNIAPPQQHCCHCESRNQ